ncbi:hypothetical protein HZA96_01055 [Candidatus Woesearchaeota archaeon]|nr:hypothetical protein [Candidatus Woesearchaeota archaeon]
MQSKLKLSLSNVSIFIIAIMLFSSFVLAAGGSSGGIISNDGSSCKADIWTCAEWTPCDKYNSTRTRSCELTVNCQNADDPKPAEQGLCTYISEMLSQLKCNQFSKMQDRVACRLELTEEEQVEQLQLQYLPEECRPLANFDEKEECVNTYAKLQKCWKYPVGDARINCVKEEIGIKSISAAKQTCVAKEGAYKGQCMQTVNKKIYWLVKFRFYDLEKRAEELMDSGISKALIIDFVTSLEEKKLKFNEANSKEKRKKIILEVRELWKEFVKNVREDRKKNKEQ